MSKLKSNPVRYRIDFISENSFNRLWSIRMGRARAIMLSLGSLAAIAALVFVLIAYTPLRQLLPGSLPRDMRGRYIATTMRVDSLENIARMNQVYANNIAAILSGESIDSVATTQTAVLVAPSSTDTLPAAGEAERAFVRAYDEENRFNLSVLAPIAAEGMIFTPPIVANAQISPVAGGGLSMNARRAVAVTAVYQGTVAGVYNNPDGTSTIVVQHPNDFISIYGGVGDVFAERGQRIVAGQRIAHTSTRVPMTFELWHNGTSLDPREYFSF